MGQAQAIMSNKNKRIGFGLGIGITLVIAILAKLLAQLPFLSIMGQLVIAILLGIAWRATIGLPEQAIAGTNFSSKKLLRFGIILLGMRLNLLDIIQAGPKVLILAALSIIVGLTVVYAFARLFKVDKKLGLLTACGTAICGAAAVVAISPQVKANNDETAVSVATIAILGTLFTLLYTLIFPFMGLSDYGYGVFSGATLHEIAHVIAAADPGGNSSVDIAVIVKLTRVALLVPVAILIGIWMNRSESKGAKGEKKLTWKSIPIPWFILGFLAMSGVNTLGIIPASIASDIVFIAYMLIAMAMAGLGLNVEVGTFKRLGMKTFAAGLAGSIVLSIFGFIMVHLLQLV